MTTTKSDKATAKATTKPIRVSRLSSYKHAMCIEFFAAQIKTDPCPKCGASDPSRQVPPTSGGTRPRR